MSNEEPWLDPDFEDPTAVGDDGWPDPPLDLDAPGPGRDGVGRRRNATVWRIPAAAGTS